MSETGPRTFRAPLLSIFQSAAAEHGASRIQWAATAISERHAMKQAGLPAAPASKPSTAEVRARLGLHYLGARIADDVAIATQLKDSA